MHAYLELTTVLRAILVVAVALGALFIRNDPNIASVACKGPPGVQLPCGHVLGLRLHFVRVGARRVFILPLFKHDRDFTFRYLEETGVCVIPSTVANVVRLFATSSIEATYNLILPSLLTVVVRCYIIPA
ncbi:hypothetical protein JVT61DRAFT_418 [Boletus reticuloceps]|uniref:Uncharacterized protein n=1 Tax=Boletus reticuloceps TaxID=495285 RepID=A0A8I2Z149_9AGAM|nr:hypothetical protein JVT61DRAFT_418 [Boletus reticuloceps]